MKVEPILRTPKRERGPEKMNSTANMLRQYPHIKIQTLLYSHTYSKGTKVQKFLNFKSLSMT